MNDYLAGEYLRNYHREQRRYRWQQFKVNILYPCIAIALVIWLNWRMP